MSEYIFNKIDQSEIDANLDVAFAICESYIKQYMIESYMQESAGVAPVNQQPQQQTVQQQQPVQQQAQPQQQNANNGINVGGIKIDANTASTLVKAIVNIVNALSKFLTNVTANLANDQAIQQMDQVQTSIEQKPVDPNTADQIINDIVQEDPTAEWTDAEKRTAKCILVGDFKDCKILTTENIQSLASVNAELSNFIKQVKGSEGKTNPEQLAQVITKTLTEQNNKLAAIIGNATEDSLRTDTHVQMSAKTYKQNIREAANQIKIANNNIYTLEQSFKTGGAGGFFDWMFNKDIAAKKISQDCMAALTKTLNYLRQTVQKISADLKSARKINSKLYNRLNTTIVNGNKGVQNFANRKASQNLGVSAQTVKRADKKQYENVQGTNLNIQ